MIAHLFMWIFQFMGAILIMGLLMLAIVGKEPKQINRRLDKGFTSIKPTRMERLRAWAHR